MEHNSPRGPNPGGWTPTYYARDPNGNLVSQRTSTGTPVYYLQDMLGSTTSLLDGTSIVRDYSYDPDGNGTTSGSGTSTPFKFAGGHDVGNGLYHYGARYYNPDLARWTQPDALSDYASLVGANRFAYVVGDPINSVDPAGLRPALSGNDACGGMTCYSRQPYSVLRYAFGGRNPNWGRFTSAVSGCVGSATAIGRWATYWGPYIGPAAIGGACAVGAIAGTSEGAKMAAQNGR